MKNLGMRKLSAVASLVCVAIFFQNCSDIQSAVLTKGQDDVSGAGGFIDPGSGEEIVVDNPETLPSGGGGSTENQVPPISGDEDSESDPQAQTPVPSTGGTGTQHPTTGTGSCQKEDEDDDNVDYSAACKNLKMFGIKNILVDATKVESVRGQVMVKSDEIELIRDHSSVLIVTGNTSVAMVKTISDVRGQTIICNAIVDRIEHVRGRLVLVNSIVNDLVDQRGKVVNIQSKIKNHVKN